MNMRFSHGYYRFSKKIPHTPAVSPITPKMVGGVAAAAQSGNVCIFL